MVIIKGIELGFSSVVFFSGDDELGKIKRYKIKTREKYTKTGGEVSPTKLAHLRISLKTKHDIVVIELAFEQVCVHACWQA